MGVSCYAVKSPSSILGHYFLSTLIDCCAVAPPPGDDVTRQHFVKTCGGCTMGGINVFVVMWCARLQHALRTVARCTDALQQQHHLPPSPRCEAGILLDVDGVLVRGGSVLPAARRAFQKLLDRSGDFLLPVVFVTNASSCRPERKAQQLSSLLDVPISPDQVVLSYSPLQTLTNFHDKCVLVSGQGPITDIAHSLGFKKVVSMEQLREQYPLLDMVDHSRMPRADSNVAHRFPQIEAVLLFGEPVRWETNLQLLVDVLLTNGRPSAAYDWSPAQLPVLACNMDLLWMAEAPSPRFGHGMFLLCLESAYKKLTGRELSYRALLGKPSLLTYRFAERALMRRNCHHKVQTIYAVGDNPMTDVYGANLYNRYLSEQHSATAETAAREPGEGEPDEGELASAARCRSVLVCTGVYKPAPARENIFLHGHRDMSAESGLLEPAYVLEDVEAAVDLVLRRHL
ncbi:haloacid dehalogenase-like hydrolase domain-containing 5 isoform X1 [Syngnathus scovelli]|uniref:haloacid dehalogenase-like hydrolase domain-containing 5 isoform X1 n=1 Tax=Syngnathus scovelli TaxID=161590 RepID=UPI00210FBF18|nr:haloacid dehalogenase-like hydrolase domain-containing 5 isoform X1 [Syngnathus scovelli]